ncbi:hypothetical protein ACHAXT_007573 [Thalassiosira profunda]
MAALLASTEVRPSRAFVGAPVGTSSAIQPRQQPLPSSYAKEHRQAMRLQSSPGSGFGSKPKVKKVRSSSQSSSSAQKQSPQELFELQELRAQLNTILKDNIPLQNLSAEKREELTKRMGTAKFVAGVEGKSWRMVFSTDNSNSEGGNEKGAEDLPYGSTVLLRIGEFMGSEGKMDYVLKFSKRVMGLNELVAKSSCSVDIGPVNPGLFTFQYEDIKTNVFGMDNLPVGFFGLLKGRVNYIDTVWFDGERWIERNYSEGGDVVYSVYVRDVEDEKK